jgi:2-keto-4-pentenoate hydratase/2-oxohepta-3-ene-1,7-dioic acid hydratase in catechol pathway
MKLVRFGPPGAERPGLWLEDGILDVRAQAFDIEDYDAHFFTHWGVERLRRLLLEKKKTRIPAGTVRLGPPIATPQKIMCLGKNYADHAVEFDAEIPTSPILFSKAPSSLIGPNDSIIVPRGSTRVDAEAELAVVMGASNSIAGYTVLNDVTDRDAQRDGKQWFRGKSSDTFCPLGPYLVTPDEIADAQAVRVYSKLNGKILQDGNTKEMIFPIAQLIPFISRTITLRPGDLISTGTPAGVGFARKPPVFLQPGDVIEVGVDGVGELRNPVL